MLLTCLSLMFTQLTYLVVQFFVLFCLFFFFSWKWSAISRADLCTLVYCWSGVLTLFLPSMQTGAILLFFLSVVRCSAIELIVAETRYGGSQSLLTSGLYKRWWLEFYANWRVMVVALLIAVSKFQKQTKSAILSSKSCCLCSFLSFPD